MESTVKAGSKAYLLSPIPALLLYLGYNFIVSSGEEAMSRFSGSFIILYLAMAIIEIFVHAICHNMSWNRLWHYAATGGTIGWAAIAGLFYYVSKIDAVDDPSLSMFTELSRGALVVTGGALAFGVLPSLTFWSIERPDRPAPAQE